MRKGVDYGTLSVRFIQKKDDDEIQMKEMKKGVVEIDLEKGNY